MARKNNRSQQTRDHSLQGREKEVPTQVDNIRITLKEKENEIRKLNESNDRNRAAISKLEDAFEMKEVEMGRLKENEEFNTHLKDDMEEKIAELQTNLQDQLSENARMRTENTYLKNRNKANLTESMTDAKTLETQQASNWQITQTVLALSEAMEAMNQRLEMQEKLLRGPSSNLQSVGLPIL